MKISDKQAQQLLQIAISSLRLDNSLAYSNVVRRQLVDDIINQQDDVPVQRKRKKNK